MRLLCGKAAAIMTRISSGDQLSAAFVGSASVSHMHFAFHPGVAPWDVLLGK